MEKWYKENKNNTSVKFVLLGINPLLGFLSALVDLKTKSSFIILFLFFICIGFSLTIPEIRTDKCNYDAITYRQNFEAYTKYDTNIFFSNLKDWVALEGESDFYADTLYFLVSRFSGNYHIMFMVTALVFSFFLLKSLRFFVLDEHFDRSLCCYILLYLFLSNQILNLNMFRYYTAMWITVYALLNVFVLHKTKYLFLLLLTPFFHGSFWLIYALFLLFYLTVKWKRIWEICFIISIFVGELSLELFRESAEFIPLLTNHFEGYLDENYVYRINEGGSGHIWVIRFLERCSIGYINLLILVLIINYKKHIKGTDCTVIYIFLLVLMSFVNFTIVIPSLGSRFVMLAFPFIAYVWLRCLLIRKNNIYIYGLGCMFIVHALLPFNIYQFPCIQHYLSLLETCFFYASPLYLVNKYIFWL